MSGWAAANGDIASRAGDHSCGHQGVMHKVVGVGNECRWHRGSARTGSGLGKSLKVVQSQCARGPARRLHLILLRICAGSRWGEGEARMCGESRGRKGTGQGTSILTGDWEAGCPAGTGGEPGQAHEGWGVLVTPGPCPCQSRGTLLLTWQRA